VRKWLTIRDASSTAHSIGLVAFSSRALYQGKIEAEHFKNYAASRSRPPASQAGDALKPE
jgi:hypothetical protein